MYSPERGGKGSHTRKEGYNNKFSKRVRVSLQDVSVHTYVGGYSSTNDP
jgi:hypothetical protein